MNTRTTIIIIQQEALEPWKGRVDLVDAALLNHVICRLTRRLHQKIVMYKGEPCVWIHYPTVRSENWLIDFTDRGLQARFAKLVELGLLIRRHRSVSNDGRCKGSRSYYGIGSALKARFEAVDSAEVVDNPNTDPHGDAARYDPHGDVAHSYETHGDAAHYDPHGDVAQSLGKESLGKGVVEVPSGAAANIPPSSEKIVEEGREKYPGFWVSPQLLQKMADFDTSFGEGSCYRIFHEDYLPAKGDKLNFFDTDFLRFLDRNQEALREKKEADIAYHQTQRLLAGMEEEARAAGLELR